MIDISQLVKETNNLFEHIVKEDGGYVVYNHDKTKKLSKIYPNRKTALKRLREIEYFKNANNR